MSADTSSLLYPYTSTCFFLQPGVLTSIAPLLGKLFDLSCETISHALACTARAGDYACRLITHSPADQTTGVMPTCCASPGETGPRGWLRFPAYAVWPASWDSAGNPFSKHSPTHNHAQSTENRFASPLRHTLRYPSTHKEAQSATKQSTSTIAMPKNKFCQAHHIPGYRMPVGNQPQRCRYPLFSSLRHCAPRSTPPKLDHKGLAISHWLGPQSVPAPLGTIGAAPMLTLGHTIMRSFYPICAWPTISILDNG